MEEKSAGAVIYLKENKTTKYLILLYGAGHWDFVKGHVEADEEEEETIVREAEEETRLIDLRILPGFKERISYAYKKDGKTIAKEVAFVTAETKTKEIKLSFEHKEYKWLEYKEALKRLTYDTAKQVLKKADLFIRKYEQQKTLTAAAANS